MATRWWRRRDTTTAPAAEFRKAMDKAGMRCVSTHHALSVLETQLDELIEYGHTLGLEYMVCSSSGGMHRDPAAKGAPTLDDWRWIAGEFNRIGEKVKAAGMTFGVHNHTPEFAMIDGVLVYDELLRLTDPKLVIFEMDAGWVYASGHNPVDYLRKSPERFPLMHVKDMVTQPDGKEQMTVLGKGSIDYGPILRAATGLKYYFVEQEQFEMEPIEELRLNAEYMRKLKCVGGVRLQSEFLQIAIGSYRRERTDWQDLWLLSPARRAGLALFSRENLPATTIFC